MRVQVEGDQVAAVPPSGRLKEFSFEIVLKLRLLSVKIDELSSFDPTRPIICQEGHLLAKGRSASALPMVFTGIVPSAMNAYDVDSKPLCWHSLDS
jgi:hypothetical protein